MKMRKMTAAALAAVLAVSAPLAGMANNAVSVVASADGTGNEELKSGDVFVDGDLKYGVQDDGTLYVYDLVNREIENLEIPKEVKGRKVTGILEYGGQGVVDPKPGLSNCTSLKSVTIPDSVTYISDYAFAGCTSLESISIPNGVEYVLDGTFYGCTSLKSATIPDSVNSIGSRAFDECTSLEKIEVSSGNADYCSVDGIVYSKDKTKLVRCPAGIKKTTFNVPDTVTEIGNDAFSDCAALESVTIPNSTTVIGYDLYQNCTSLTDVKLPDNLTKIPTRMFYGCTSLENLTIPESVTEIGYYAFFNCTSLKSFTIPANTEGWSLYYYTFCNCYSLEKIEVDSNNEELCSVDGVLFNKDKTQIICYPAGKKETAYTIPDSVTTIKEATFYGNRSLNSITIPDSVTKIERNAFQDSISLTEITIPNTVTSIEVYTFENCTSLKNVKFVGTKEEWDKVTVDEHNDSLKNAAITFTDSTTSDPTTSEPTSSEPTSSKPTTSTGTPGDTDKPAEQETIDATLKGVDSKDGLSGAALEKQLFGESGWTWAQVEKIEFTSDKLFSVQYTATDGSTKTLGETAARAENDGIWNTAWTLDTSLMSKDKPSVKLLAKDGTADITAKVYIKKDAQKPSNSDQKNTGIALAIAPIVLAASVVIVASKKRK